MPGYDFDELAGRIDAVAWSVMLLAAHLEKTGRLDGPAHSQALRRRAETQADGGLRACARVLEQMASMLDEAREARRMAAG